MVNPIGVVDDLSGNTVSVEATGAQVVIGFAVDEYRIFDPGQITSLIHHLETARDEALIAEINAEHDEADDE